MIKIKHVIWDWNGTLINDAWLFVELMNEELYSRNLPQINVDEYRQYFTFPVKKYYEALGFDFEKEDFKEVGYNFIQKFKQRKFEANLFEDSIDILEYFKNLNIKQSIVSAQEHKLLNQTIKHYKINHYFESITGIEHYYADNKVKIAQTVRKNIPFNNNKIIMIGDSVHDYEVAQKLNIECILISKGHYTKKRLLKCNCQIIDDHTELKKILS
jgi:phosphoglycolate phosphatase